MTSISPPARGAVGVRAAVVVFALVLSVLIHHQIAGGAGHAMAAPSVMAAGDTGKQQAQHAMMPMHSASEGSQNAYASPAGHGGCDGQMCAAASLAKTPSMAPVLLAAVTAGTAGSDGAAIPLPSDTAPARPPGASAVLRI